MGIARIRLVCQDLDISRICAKSPALTETFSIIPGAKEGGKEEYEGQGSGQKDVKGIEESQASNQF